MGGVNPYIAPARVKPPTKKYKITFLPANVTVEVDPSVGRYGHNGLPLSVLDISEGAGVDIDHSCGGVCACSTCHVIVDPKDFEKLPPASDEEEDLLDLAVAAGRTSRLACQIILTEDLESLSVRVPPEARNWMGR